MKIHFKEQKFPILSSVGKIVLQISQNIGGPKQNNTKGFQKLYNSIYNT